MSKNNVAGQLSLFGDLGDFGAGISAAVGEADMKAAMPDVRNFDKPAILAMEKDVLGVYVSGHPLEDYADRIRQVSSISTDMLETENGQSLQNDGKRIVIAGMIVSKRTMITKKNTMMAFIQLEDLYGMAEVIVFPNVYERLRDKIREDNIVAVRGNLQYRDDEQPKIIASDIQELDSFNESEPYSVRSDVFGRDQKRFSRSEDFGTSQNAGAQRDSAPAGDSGWNRPQAGWLGGQAEERLIKLTVPQGRDETEVLNRLNEIVRRYPGRRNVVVKLAESGKTFKAGTGVQPCDDLYAELYELIRQD